MTLFDLAIETGIPLRGLQNYLEYKTILINLEEELSDDIIGIIKNNIVEINEFLNIKNIENKLEGPKILGKIDLPEIMNNTPRLMAAAKEFNIGKDTLIEYLIQRGFNREDLKPTAKLTPEMYMLLLERYNSDKFESNLSKQINIPSFKDTESNKFRGLVDSEFREDSFKISFINSERLFKNGKPFLLEKPDPLRWILAPKDKWKLYNLKHGDKISFKVEIIEVNGKKKHIAVPVPNEQIITTNLNLKLFEKDEKIDIQIDNKQIFKMNTNISPIQKIIFGSPGTGKSYQIVDSEFSYFKKLYVNDSKPDLIKTVFHPEYTYGDFMGKLMPLTNRGKVEYRYYAGHFMLALGLAYKNIIFSHIEYIDKVEEIEKDFKLEIKKNKSDYNDIEKLELQRRVAEIQKPKPKNVLLVIDEINRGNSAAIFGTVFQLLDRDNHGWSSYPVKISELELKELLNVIGLYDVQEGKVEEVGTRFCGEPINRSKYDNYLKAIFGDLDDDKKINLMSNDIKIPPNLSIIATMNTSDNSIYFMDSAFKRRWDWEFIDITSESQKSSQSGRIIEDGYNWDEFVDSLNSFIKKYGERIRKIEDKQIGYFFIKGDIITHEAIKNKLMFFLWDSIFSNDKKPIKELLGLESTLVTFGDFIKHYDLFLNAIKKKSFINDVF